MTLPNYDHRESTRRLYRTRPDYTRVIPEWHEEAACGPAAREPGMAAAWTNDGWHPFEDEAKRICEECPVRKACLKGAMEDPLAEGIYAGFDFSGGRFYRDQVKEASRVLGSRIPHSSRHLRNRPAGASLRETV